MMVILGAAPLAGAQDDWPGACQFILYHGGAFVYSAPLVDPALTYDSVSGDTVKVFQRSDVTPDAMFYVEGQFGPGGWVPASVGELTGDCADLPVDDRPIDRIPHLCTVTVPPDTRVYADAWLSTPLPDRLAAGIYILTREAANSVFVIIDDTTGGWLRASTAQKGAGCTFTTQYIPALAIARAEARLWEWSGVSPGHQLGTLIEGEPVAILGEPEEGSIRFDSDVMGEWWPVAQGDQVGWVWAERLNFGGELLLSTNETGTASVNAELWATPSLWIRHVVDYVEPGMALQVIAGPVQAVNFLDPVETGAWYYYVQPEGGLYAGWLSGEYIAFE